MLQWLSYPSTVLSILTASAICIASPGDPLGESGPGLESSAPSPSTFEAGEYGVSEKNGAATYSLPIVVPPGRAGMAPKLALTYSSQAPLRGGVAAGWTLDLPVIRRDFTNGALGPAQYSATLKGAVGRLIPVPSDISVTGGASFRTRIDDTFTRFEFTGAYWIAFSGDGVRHVFGDSSTATDGVTRWYLTAEIDRLGNAISYIWQPIFAPSTSSAAHPVDYQLQRIEYTSNSAAGLLPYARVDLSYEAWETCGGGNVPKGARVSYVPALGSYQGNSGGNYPDGIPVYESAERLHAINVSVRDTSSSAWRVVRTMTPQFNAAALACTGPSAPLRVLDRLEVVSYDAHGTATPLPPLRFTYGAVERTFSNSVTLTTPLANSGQRAFRAATLASQLVDVDGDGLVDRATVDHDTCALHIFRGQRGGGFASTATDLSLTPALIGWGGAISAYNHCDFSGQWTTLENVHPHTGGDYNISVNTFHFQDVDGDGRVDLITQIHPSVAYQPRFDQSLPHPVVTCTLAGNGTGGGGGGPGGGVTGPGGAETDCNGHYVWRVFRNNGSGFDPIQAAGTPNATTSLLDLGIPGQDAPLGRFVSDVSGTVTMLDMDGDRHPDFIMTNGSTGWATYCPTVGDPAQAQYWAILRGDGKGGFESTPSCWRVPLGSTLVSHVGGDGSGGLFTTDIALRDMNGDGLPDLVSNGSVAFSYGHGFLAQWVTMASVPLLDQSRLASTSSTTTDDGSRFVTGGTRTYDYRMLDVDGDGLIDLVRGPAVTGSGWQVLLNGGDQLLPPLALPSGPWSAAAQEVDATPSGAWWTSSDYFDADGDGLPDLVTWSPGGDVVGSAIRAVFASGFTPPSMTIHADAHASGPQHLLVAVDNGRGMVLQFAYATSTDPAVVAHDAPESHLPWATWVVRQLSVTGGFGTPTATSLYSYANPIYGPEGDPSEPSRFLGFERVTTDQPAPVGEVAGGRRIRDYAYDPALVPGVDGRGRLVREWQYGRNGAAPVLVKYMEHQWQRDLLFGGAVTFTHEVGATERTCAAGATDAACVSQTDNVLRTTETWTPWSTPSGVIVLYRKTAEQMGSGLSPGADDRKAVYEHQVRYGQSGFPSGDYRVLVSSVEHQAATPAHALFFDTVSFSTIDRRTYNYETATGLLSYSTDWLADGSAATTLRTYDASTGNLRTLTKPQQLITDGNHTTYTYDANQLFVATTTNELGHVVIDTHDLSTGALVERDGPNSKSVAKRLVRTRETWSVDGLGRVLTHGVPVDDVSAGYVTKIADTQTYYDFEAPARIRSQRALDFDGAVQVTSDKQLDGLGRLLSETRRRFLPGQPDAVTTYWYDNAGFVWNFQTPDPRVDTGATVSTTFQHDAVGRSKAVLHGDDSGVAISYAGLDRTVTEVAADGSGGTKVEHGDVFGRTTTLDEIDPAATATTQYHYDAKGRLTQVVDADGNPTQLDYDWLGRRTAIRRGARVWLYGYDANGNLTSETAPMPATAESAQYTSTTQYDDLDRPITRTPAARDLTAEHSAQLAIGPTTYMYDGSAGPSENAIGRLTRVTLPFGATDYAHEARGLVTRQQRMVAVHYPTSLTTTEWVTTSYNALGQPTLVTHDDGTQWRTDYDARGLAQSVTWLDPSSGAWKQVAGLTLSLAGQPRATTSAYGPARAWTFDLRGRPIDDQISVSGAPRSRHRYDYFGDGDVRDETISDPLTNGTLTFGYDKLHRLTSASGPLAYAGAWSYSPAGNILSANMSWTGAGSAARNVAYHYGELDPQAVDVLTNGDGSPYAKYGYDLSGNAITRTTPERSWILTFDGEDDLREAQGGPDGGEAYYYDEAHNRTLAVNGVTGARFWFGASESHFSPSGVLTKRYIHLSVGGQPIARIENGTKLELQFADTRGNLLLAVDSTGATTSAFVYGGFGEVLAATGADTHPRQVNGKEDDAETRMRYYGLRYYDPVSLRWNAADPLYRFVPEIAADLAQRLNLYSFSLNNPMRFVDLDGRLPGDIERGETITRTWSISSISTANTSLTTSVSITFPKKADVVVANDNKPHATDLGITKTSTTALSIRTPWGVYTKSSTTQSQQTLRVEASVDCQGAPQGQVKVHPNQSRPGNVSFEKEGSIVDVNGTQRLQIDAKLDNGTTSSELNQNGSTSTEVGGSHTTTLANPQFGGTSFGINGSVTDTEGGGETWGSSQPTSAQIFLDPEVNPVDDKGICVDTVQ
jgi:RHS repeat-associated protein